MIDDETPNLSVRKFLNRFGVEAQRTMEDAIRRADAAGQLEGNNSIGARTTLDLPYMEGTMELKDEISFG